MQYLHLFLFDESHNPYTSISLSSLFRNLFCSFSESNPSLLYTSCASVLFEPEFALIKANLFAAAYFSTASRIIICSFFWSNCFTQCIFFSLPRHFHLLYGSSFHAIGSVSSLCL